MKNQQHLKPLAVLPVFRANALYCAMFPEIEPLFKENEVPSPKKLYEFLAQQAGKSVMLDLTCFFAGHKNAKDLTLADFPEALELKKVPTRDNGETLIVWDVYKAFRKKMDVRLSQTAIDSVIENSIEKKFDKETVKTILTTAKQKNADIKEVILITNHINNHIGKIITPETELETIILFREGIKEELGLEMVTRYDIAWKDIKPTNMVIVDRHHPMICKENEIWMDWNFNRLLILPIASELHYQEKFLGKKTLPESLAGTFRKYFETI